MERRVSKNTNRNFGSEIRTSWRNSIECFFKTGDLLNEAKAAMKDWKKFVQSDEVPFGYDTANRLCKIAACPFLRKVAHAQLPADYTTLALLADLTEDDFTYALDNGNISADMNRADATLLKRRKLVSARHGLPKRRSSSRPAKTRDRHEEIDANRKTYLDSCDGLTNDELDYENDRCTEGLNNLRYEDDDFAETQDDEILVASKPKVDRVKSTGSAAPQSALAP